MRALGFEPKKEEIKKMIADIDKVSGADNLGSGLAAVPLAVLVVAPVV